MAAGGEGVEDLRAHTVGRTQLRSGLVGFVQPQPGHRSGRHLYQHRLPGNGGSGGTDEPAQRVLLMRGRDGVVVGTSQAEKPAVRPGAFDL